MNDQRNWEPDEYGEVPVLCWCEGSIVFVKPEVVRKGLTKSCKARGCNGAPNAS